MPPDSNQLSPPPAAETNADAGARTGTEAARAFWQVLTHFDSAKLSTHRAFRNAIGVVLPLIAGFALGMPRGGLVVASGALNVSYSDSSDPYSDRARRMLASTAAFLVVVLVAAIVFFINSSSMSILVRILRHRCVSMARFMCI